MNTSIVCWVAHQVDMFFSLEPPVLITVNTYRPIY